MGRACLRPATVTVATHVGSGGVVAAAAAVSPVTVHQAGHQLRRSCGARSARLMDGRVVEVHLPVRRRAAAAARLDRRGRNGRGRCGGAGCSGHRGCVCTAVVPPQRNTQAVIQTNGWWPVPEFASSACTPPVLPGPGPLRHRTAHAARSAAAAAAAYRPHHRGHALPQRLHCGGPHRHRRCRRHRHRLQSLGGGGGGGGAEGPALNPKRSQPPPGLAEHPYTGRGGQHGGDTGRRRMLATPGVGQSRVPPTPSPTSCVPSTTR